MAPLWMTSTQRKGTPGREAQWEGNPRAPLSVALSSSLYSGRGAASLATANFTRAQEWFEPRYAAWRADPRKALTTADVLAAWPSMFQGGDHCTEAAESALEAEAGWCREQVAHAHLHDSPSFMCADETHYLGGNLRGIPLTEERV